MTSSKWSNIESLFKLSSYSETQIEANCNSQTEVRMFIMSPNEEIDFQ